MPPSNNDIDSDDSVASSLEVVDLRINYETDPIDAPTTPRFSWRGESSSRGAGQTAYRILVSRSPDALEAGHGELWDSGKVSDSKSIDIPYEGLSLESEATYYWTVRIWDENGTPSAWADVASFSTALEGRRDWAGEWIGYGPNGGDSNGYRSRWRSIDDETDEWVQVDLGAERSIDRVELHPATPFDGPETPDGVAVPARDGFGFPREYRIDVSTDPDRDGWTTVVERERSQDTDGSGRSAAAVHDVDAAGRFVRVVATDCYAFEPGNPPHDYRQLKTEQLREERRPWETFALAALAVRDADGNDLAVGNPVEASSSVEDKTWGRDRLIDGRYEPTTAPGSPLLRTEIDLSGAVESARAHVCTLGYGELYVNGERIGDEVLNPAWTQYDDRALYSTHDVTDALSKGANALGLWLGRGWFSKCTHHWTGFGSPRAICQLEITYEDGRTRTVSTDGSWEATASPIIENDVYDGETYDARREQPGWATPAFEPDEAWEPATVVNGPGGDLVAQRTPPIRVTETLEPVEITADDELEGPIVDFGQNLVGWVELEIEGASAGDEIELRHAETLLESGELATVDLRSADGTDRYVARNGSVQTYEPRFTYHGFRYAQIVGYPGELDAEAVRAKVVHTDVEATGDFDCSNEELAQVQENAQWGLRGNLHGVLTDCPQRDERFGWTGDNHVAARALMYNFDAARFYQKWMADHADVRSEHGYVAGTIPFGFGSKPEEPTWGITQVTIPWHLYRHYGDVGVLERHYEGMRRYVDYWHSVAEDGIVPAEYGEYGDWLAFENADGRRGLPFDLFNTAFHYHTTALFAEIAATLGNETDADRYEQRADRIARAFDEAFFDPDELQYGPGTQASYAVPLFVGLVPDNREAEIAAQLAEKVRGDGGKLQTGFLGTRPLVHVLVEYGYPEIAYEVVSQPERPGWVYMVRQGATTTWERWDSDSRIGDGMNSFNHSPFNFVSEWFFEALAGLRFDDSIRTGALEIAPTVVNDLEWTEGSVETVSGRLSSRWERTDEGLKLEIEVPWNAEAAVRIPGDADEVTISDQGDVIWDAGAIDGDGSASALPDGIESVRDDDGTVVAAVGSGSYRFAVR